MLNTAASGRLSWVLNVLGRLWLKLMWLLGHNRSAPSTNDHAQIPKASGMVPLCGTLIDLIAAGGAPQLHKYIDQRHRELGPIFGERLGGTQDAVFVSSASLMRAVFVNEGQYPRHPLPDAWTLYNREYNCQRGLFFMEGAEWLHNRRILNRFLINGRLDWMDAHIEACSEKLIRSWRVQMSSVEDENGDFKEIADLEGQLYRWAIDVICSIMFGESAGHCERLEEQLDQFALIVHRIFETSSRLMSFPPQLAKRLHLPMWSQFRQSVAEVLQQGEQIIDSFVAMCGEEVLPFHLDDDALFPKLQSAGMPLPMIKRIFVDLVIAAGDTTAYTLEWSLYLLSQNSQLQEQISLEVHCARANESPLINGLIRETLRLYPVAPFIGRYMDADCTLGGFEIKQDTLVLLSLYTAGRAADHFPDPLSVKPERWLRDRATGELQGVLQAHGSLPFAIGNRSCIGRRIAMNQMASLLAKICANFQLKCLNTTPIESRLRLITVPNETLRLAIKCRDL